MAPVTNRPTTAQTQAPQTVAQKPKDPPKPAIEASLDGGKLQVNINDDKAHDIQVKAKTSGGIQVIVDGKPVAVGNRDTFTKSELDGAKIKDNGKGDTNLTIDENVRANVKADLGRGNNKAVARNGDFQDINNLWSKGGHGTYDVYTPADITRRPDGKTQIATKHQRTAD